MASSLVGISDKDIIPAARSAPCVGASEGTTQGNGVALG
jgi:hypothetical protein